MVKITRRIRESKNIKRFLTTLILTIAISLFYFNLFKFLETPKLKEKEVIKISYAFIWISNIFKIEDKSYFYIEKIYKYEISYPYVIKKPFYCYDLPKNANYLDLNYEPLEISIINDKVCISSNIKEFLIREVESKKLFDFVKILKYENSTKIFIKNPYDFPMNLDLRIDVKNLVGISANVYRSGLLVAENVTLFLDSKILAPYSNFEYEIRI